MPFINLMDPVHAFQLAAREMPAERYVVDRPVDARGQYQLELPGSFPLSVKRLEFDASQPARPLTWHTYLEVFVPLSGECRIKMGEQVLTLARGDVLVMDHLKLHAVLDFPGHKAEAIVIRFLPDIALGRGAFASDHLLLLPFYCQADDRPRLVTGTSRAAAEVRQTLAHLITAYAAQDESLYWQTGSRAFFIELLHHLARHFRAAEDLKEQYAQQQVKTHRLRKLFEHISDHYATRISLPEAAAITGLSRPRFHAVFKKATGMTLVAYLTHVRLAQAARLLKETARSVAEVAAAVGFADQSYFDRRFRRHYGQSPLQFRKGNTNHRDAGSASGDTPPIKDQTSPTG